MLNSHLEVVGTRLETCGAKNGQVLPLAIIVKACHLNTSIVKLQSTTQLIPVRTERLLCWTTSSPIGGWLTWIPGSLHSGENWKFCMPIRTSVELSCICWEAIVLSRGRIFICPMGYTSLTWGYFFISSGSIWVSYSLILETRSIILTFTLCVFLSPCKVFTFTWILDLMLDL